MASRSSRVATISAACLLGMLMMGSCINASHGRVVMVGGPATWRFGYNYSDWAMKTAPFLVGDTLEFIYKPTMFNGIAVNHNVYRLRSRKAYENCSFAKSIMLANTSQGEPGFKFPLTERKKPIYFACSIGDGLHCNEGLMKFWVKPL